MFKAPLLDCCVCCCVAELATGDVICAPSELNGGIITWCNIVFPLLHWCAGWLPRDRSHWGRLRLAGEGARAFCHNQSTNDFNRLGPGQGCDTVFVTSTARTLDLATALVRRLGCCSCRASYQSSKERVSGMTAGVLGLSARLLCASGGGVRDNPKATLPCTGSVAMWQRAYIGFSRLQLMPCAGVPGECDAAGAPVHEAAAGTAL